MVPSLLPSSNSNFDRTNTLSKLMLVPSFNIFFKISLYLLEQKKHFSVTSIWLSLMWWVSLASNYLFKLNKWANFKLIIHSLLSSSSPLFKFNNLGLDGLQLLHYRVALNLSFSNNFHSRCIFLIKLSSQLQFCCIHNHGDIM